MKRLFLALLLLGAGFAFAATSVSAQRLNSSGDHSNTCTYQSTQARVKRPGVQPWEKSLNLSCGETFEVGGFHNQTGQYANDVKIQVKGPGINQTTDINGKSFALHRSGTYEVTVTTKNMKSTQGNACWDKAVVTVSCASDTPVECPYRSTQVRVKRESDKRWVDNLVIRSCRPERVMVGSFHDNSLEFAKDTFVRVWLDHVPRVRHQLENGQSFLIMPGENYTVKARTMLDGPIASDHSACKDKISVVSVCDWQPR